MKKSKHIVVASNPFGYGPTGNAIPILHELVDRFQGSSNTTVHFVGSGLCIEILPDIEGVFTHQIDERNVEELESFLLTLDGSVLCVAVQNRFLPVASKNVGIECYFLDLLAWFWSEIPGRHMIADKVYWMKFPGIKKKAQKYDKVKIINGIYKTAHRQKVGLDFFMIFNIGGGRNPLREGVQKNYLKLLAEVLSETKHNFDKVYISTGKDASEFLQKNIRNNGKNIVESFKHEEFLRLQGGVNLFVSIGGQSSTMEALLSGIPLIFYLPSNLSQVALQDVFNGAVKGTHMRWEDYVTVNNALRNISEREAINVIEKYADSILGNKIILKKVVEDFTLAVNKTNESKGLWNLAKSLGSDGAIQIVDDIESYINSST